MRRKLWMIGILAIALLLPTSGVLFAQNVNLEWNRWDDRITVSSNSSQFQVAETQEVHVLTGPLHFGTRTWDGSVQVQSVYLIGSDGTPRQFSQSSNPGGYTVTQSGNQTTLRYNLPDTLNSGDTYTVQINYIATTPTSGILDWRVIPSDHAYPIRSSTTRISFPDGQAPDSSLVRITTNNATANINGNQVIIQSTGTIAPQQQLAIQMPFGAGVGAAGNNSGNGSNPINPNNNGDFNNNGNNGGFGTSPTDPTNGGNVINLPSGGTLLLMVCGLGLLLLFGGGGLLRALLGGLLGGALGGNRSGLGGLLGGGGYSNQGGGLFGRGGNIGGSPFNSNSSIGGERGFRQSASQNREIPTINNDKGSGGGAGFG